jgi:hypothetical protein
LRTSDRIWNLSTTQATFSSKLSNTHRAIGLVGLARGVWRA